jgi:hypothetical protein
MRIIRSFPRTIPPGRAYVQDDYERFLMSNYDYTGLADQLAGDDCLLLEWDIAVSRHDVSMFIARAHPVSDWPMVAPYLLDRTGSWPHLRVLEDGKSTRRIERGEPDCDLFGFGMVFFPNWVLRDHPRNFGNSSVTGDGTVPAWLRTLPHWKPVPVDWGTTVVHLH